MFTQFLQMNELRNNGKGHPEADIVVIVVRVVVVPIGRPAVLSVVVPVAAPKHPVRAVP